MKAAQAIQFDTHKFVKHLTENGFTERQAEALAEEQVNLLNSNLATKADILALKADIEKLRQETKADMANLRAELVKWVYGAMVAQVILIVSLVVALIKLLP